MKLDIPHLTNGILAGFFSAAIVACGMVISEQFSFISFLAPLPIFLAGFLFGTLSSIFAAACASLIIYLVLPSLVGFITPDLPVVVGQNDLTALVAHSLPLNVVIQSFVPAVLGSWLGGLAKPQSLDNQTKQLMWYPISDILFFFAFWIACSHALAWKIILPPELFNSEIWIPQFKQFITDLPFDVSEDERANAANTLLSLLPMIAAYSIGISGLVVLTGNLYLSMAIAQRLKGLKRPRELWPNHLRMSRNSLYAFLLMIVMLMVMPFGGLGSIFICLALGALAGGFMLSGLAMMHAKLPPSPFRPLILACVYFISITFQFPLLIFIVVGLFDTRRRITLSNV